MLVDSSKIGGIETHILNVAQLLKAHHIEAKVLFLKNYNNDVFYKRLAQARIQYDFLSGIKNLFKYIQSQADNVVIHTHGYKAGILARLASLLCRKQVVSTFHAGETHSGLLGLYCWLDNYSSLLSKNFAVSEQIGNKIHNPENLKNFVLQSSSVLNKKASSELLQVGFVGRLSKEKGPEQFLALADHFKTNTNLRFHVFGDGVLRNLFDGSSVVMHGMCEPEEIWATLDVLVISSYFEGLPMTVLEAMAHGVFVICPHIGALNEVITHNTTGFVVENNQSKHLINALEERLSLTEQEATLILQNAKAYCFEQFGGIKQWHQLDAAYRAILNV
jgi:hypothetical protein